MKNTITSLWYFNWKIYQTTYNNNILSISPQVEYGEGGECMQKAVVAVSNVELLKRYIIYLYHKNMM